MKKRFKVLEAKSLQEGRVPTESQMAALENAQEDKEAHGNLTVNGVASSRWPVRYE